MNQSEQIDQLAAALVKAQGRATRPDEWVLVAGRPGYAVHPAGLVFSVRGSRPAMLRGTTAGNGYRAVMLAQPGGGYERIYIHRLIASVFLPADPDRPQVNHKDGNKQNNAVSNLEWCSCAENLTHARTTGLITIDGLRAYNTRLTTDEVRRIRALRSAGHTYVAIARAVGCSPMQANRIARGLLRKDD